VAALSEETSLVSLSTAADELLLDDEFVDCWRGNR
jgi:hypothetical protein